MDKVNVRLRPRPLFARALREQKMNKVESKGKDAIYKNGSTFSRFYESSADIIILNQEFQLQT